MQRGELSYSKVRALTRVATPTNEAQLLDVAQCATAAHVEKLVRAWRRVDRTIAAQEAQRRHQYRQLHTWMDDDGMLVIRGRLTPEVGAVVQRALDAAADRYQVVLHVEGGVREDRVVEQAVLDGGPYVAAETSRRLACDASLVVMRHAADGLVLDVGRKTRTIPPAIRRALTARDAQCRFPGCTGRHTDAHHIEHWANGGITRLDNLILLCRRHHRAVHEEGWTVAWGADGEAQFTRPNGVRLETAPAAPRWRETPPWPDACAPNAQPPEDASPLAPTTARLAAAGIVIGPRTGWPQWYGEPLNVGYVIDVLRQDELRAQSAAGTDGWSRPPS